MDFLTSGLWWGFFIVTVIDFIIYQMGRLGNGIWKNKMQLIGGWLAIIFVILTFVFTGWKGGLANLIGTFIMGGLISVLILSKK